MNFDERVHVVAKLGFTERQARFLVNVVVHAGVCVPRQYATFCGIVHGQKTRKFFAKLVRLRHAQAYECRHNRARIYHVNGAALYRAAALENSRLRRRQTLGRAIHRLMVLDAIVESADMVWLGTPEDKEVHLTSLTRIDPADLPHTTSDCNGERVVRYFADNLPIGIHLAGRGVLVYVLTPQGLDVFRDFLERHAAVLRALPAWTLRIVIPSHLAFFRTAVSEVVVNQLMSPLDEGVISNLRWYFERLREHPTPSRCDLDQPFFDAHSAYAQPKFRAVHRRWKQDGERALAHLGSSSISDAVTSGAGVIDVLDLGHRYGHLSPLVAVA
jgi:hypothetical protein